MKQRYAVSMEVEVEGDTDVMEVAAQVAGDLCQTPGYRFFNLSVEQDFIEEETGTHRADLPI